MTGLLQQKTGAEDHWDRIRESLPPISEMFPLQNARSSAPGESEAMRLRGIIQNVLDGNYPNPRDHRPGTCKHGTHYWKTCEQCLDEYLSAALAQEAGK